MKSPTNEEIRHLLTDSVVYTKRVNKYNAKHNSIDLF